MTINRVRRIDVEPSARLLRRRIQPVLSSPWRGGMMPPPTEFHASMADVTNEEHQNMAGMVHDADFNANVVVRFLRNNGIDASVDEATGGFRFKLVDPTHESDVHFACVCLRASISYAIEAAFWCTKAKR